MTESLQTLFSSDLETGQSLVGPPRPFQLCPQPRFSIPLLPHHPDRVRRSRGDPVSGNRLHCASRQPSRHLEPSWDSPGKVRGHIASSEVKLLKLKFIYFSVLLPNHSVFKRMSLSIHRID